VPTWVSLAVALAGGVARADASDVKVACTNAHEQGQLLRNAGKLLAGRDRFVECSREACPVMVRKDCAELVARVEAELPTVVVAARDPGGQDTADVRVLIDGRVVEEHLDGMPFGADPGEHVIRFEKDGALPVEQTLVLQAGEKGRRVAVAFQAATASPPRAPWPSARSGPPVPAPDVRRAPSTFAYALGGLAIAAAGSFTYFAIAGKLEENDLAVSCAPNCADSAVAPVRRDYLVADVSLGVAALAAGAALWLFTHHPVVRRVQLAPVVVPSVAVGGAALAVGGRF
jgi:hypothetical protein